MARKQQIGESLEQFYSVLSGLAAQCNFGTLETRILRDVFTVNMNNREAQNELCRSTKTPEEVHRIALSYERGHKYAKSYESAIGGATTSGTTGGNGAFSIKTEPVGTIRGGYQNNRQRGRGSFRVRAEMRGGISRSCPILLRYQKMRFFDQGFLRLTKLVSANVHPYFARFLCLHNQ